MWRGAYPTLEQVLAGVQVRLFDPSGNIFSGLLGDLELDWPLRRPLQDNRSSRDRVALSNIAHAQADEVTAT